MAASISQNGRFRAVFLSVIMVLMTQVGYTENMDFSLSFDEENELLETGGSTSNSSSNNLSPSRDNVVATVGEPMAEISWYHDVSPSGGNAGTTTQGNGSTWFVNDKFIHSVNKANNIGTTIGDTFYYVATGGDRQNTSRVIYSYNKSTDTLGEVGTFGTMPTYSGSYSNSRALDFFANAGGVLLFDGPGIDNITAYNPATDSSYSIGVSYGGVDGDGTGLSILVGDTLYFAGVDSTTSSVGAGLYAYTAGNNTTWLAADINPPSSDANYTVSMTSMPGWYHGFRLIGDTIYFDAAKGHRTPAAGGWQNAIVSTDYSGLELFAYNPSNHSSWQVTDIDNRIPVYNSAGTLSSVGNGLAPQCIQYSISGFQKTCNENTMTVVGDTLFFAGQDSNSDIELWAHDTSNHSTWQVANINTLPSTEVTNFCKSPNSAVYGLDMSHIFFSSEPGGFYTIGDTVYFTATNGFYGRELWAYDTSNNSVWQVTRFYRCDDAGYSINNELYHFDGENNFNIVGDELFFIRDGGLYIHNDSTQHTKRLWTPNKHHRDSFTEWRAPGAVVMGDTLYGLQLSVSQPRFNYAPTDCPPISAGGCRMQGSFLYAYDSSNETLYRTAFLPGTGFSSTTGGSFHELIIASGDTILFGGGYQYVYAHQPAEISYPKERVSEASCTISPTLPAGLNFDSNQCTISGTPTAPTSQASYTVTAVINNTTYQGNVLLETSYYPIKASVTGSDAKIGTPIDDITFQIDPMVGISSGSGGNSESSGSDSSNGVVCEPFSGYHTCEGTVRNWYGSDYRSDYGTGLSFDWSSHVFGEAVATIPNFVDGIPIDSAVDSNGHVHIVVMAENSVAYKNNLTYVTNQSGSWQSIVIDDSAYHSSMISIAIDSNDNVHIVYYSTFDSNGNNVGSRIKYATNENGSWVTSVVTTDAENPSNIAIDSQDNLHIAFIGHERYGTYDQGSAQIANYTNGSWTVSTVYTNSTYATSGDYESFRGRHAVLAIDSNDSLHLSWGVKIDDEMVIHYSTNQSGTWSDALVDRYDNSDSAKITDSILVDSNDNVHLLHHKSQRYNANVYTGAITHYTQENGTWTNSTAYHSKCAHGSTSLPANSCEIEAAIDSNDVIHIAYEVEEKNTATQHSSALTKVQYSNNANGYFSPGVDVYPARNVANMVFHSNGDVDFIYLLKNHPPGYGSEDKLILTSMNNSELNPSFPMYENNKIATGYNHSCGIIHDNSLVCWGSDYYGQLGDGGTNTDRPYVATYLPVDLGTDRTALAVAAGHSHTCAILDDGSLKCWGDNSHGQLGDGSTTDRTSPVQVDLGSGNTAVAISAGHSHTCAILQDGTLKCWGQDSNGQVGDGGTNSDQSSPVTINLGSGRTADMVSTGIHHTCAVLDDGSIKCWGLNNEGQLGDGSTTNSGTPVSVNLDAGKTAYAVAAGLHHTCAIVDDHVECWGNNDYYQLKGGYWTNPVYQGIDHSSTEPVVTATYYDYQMGKLRAISAGYNHTCLVTDYAMNCWGNRTDSTSSVHNFPCYRYDCWHEAPWIDEDIGLENETHIAVSSYGNRHCAITSFGKVVCRGYFAEDSNLEYDNYMTSVNHEYAYWYVDNLDAVNVYQWNNTAEAGSATSPNMVSYDDVKYKFSGGGSTTAGQMHTTSSQTMCLVHSTDIHNVASRDFRDPFYYSFYGSDIDQWNHRDGSLVCRGTGSNQGQSELHSRSTSHFVSMDIPEERTVEYISPGNSCVILDDGSLMCWGYNYHGQVGDGTDYSNSAWPYYKYSPVYVDLGEGRTAVAVDNSLTSHACAILDNGAVKCWGRNDNGRLGDGSTTNSATPVSVSLPAGRTAVALASGQSHNCVILDNASVMCWGDGYGGALGNGNIAAQTTPVYVDLGTNRIPVKISSYSSYSSLGTTCVVFDDGSLTCWGGQGFSQTPSLPVNYTLPAGRTAFDVAIGEESNVEYVYVHLDDNKVCRKTSYNGDCNYVGYSHLPTSSASIAYESTDLTAVAISAGNGGLCAVLVNGMLRCTDGQYSYGTYGLLHTYDMVGGFSNTGSGSGGHSSGGMTGISGATCTVSPALPAGLSIDSSTCTISGTPTAVASNTTYTIVATLNNVNYQGTFWLSSSYYELIPSVDGADLTVGKAMDNITFQYDSSAASGSGSGSSTSSAFAYANDKAATGAHHSCAILDNGDLKCWGSDEYGQLGDGGSNTNTNAPSSTAIDLGTGRTAVAVSAGQSHTCAILDNGDVKCWGNDLLGTLGDGGTNTNTNAPSSTAVDLGTGRTAVAVSAGDYHTCVILDNGDLKCWGLDQYGQLGDGGSNTNTNAPSSTAIDLGTGRTAVAVSGGEDHTCAILDNGDVKCWGRDFIGQLGDGGSNTDQGSPVSLSGSNTWDSSTGLSSGSGSGGSVTSSLAAQNIAGGRYHTCAIVDNGSVACWGDNSDGQLGDGTTTDRSTPTITNSLGAGRTAVQVATGDYFTCVMLDNDEVKCWGRNNYGQLGDGTTTAKTSPPSSAITFPTGLTPVALVAGDEQACAIMDDESLTCWGRNSDGELGDGTTTTGTSPTAVSLNAGENVIDVGSGDVHTCALLDDGSIKCWGSNYYGQLGDGTNFDRSLPTSTASLGAGRTAVDIGVGEFGVCALLDNDDVKCWGRNDNGQLGDGTNTDKNSPPSSAITFPTGRTPVAISDSGAGIFFACALLDDGNVSCWGYNKYGQLGDGTTTDRNTPVLTDSLGTGRTAVHVTTGYRHACALLDNGDITCWGHNSDGQLGDGTTTDRSSPTAVSTSYSFDTSRVMGSGSGSGSGSSMTNVAGATCTVSPALPTGLSINGSTCTISGTPTVETSNTTYTVTANISGTTYQGTVWLATVPFGTITSPVMGAELDLGEAMAPIALNYTSLAPPQAPAVSWEIHPELPEGMSLVNGVISGTPSVYAVNQTYTVYANQSGETTTFDMYFSVDTNNPHTVVENQPIDAIGFQDPFQNGVTNWTVSPALPADLVMDPNTGEITGSVNGVLANTTYTVTATHSSSGSGGSGSTFVNNSGNVGAGSSNPMTKIAVDSNGNKHITYYSWSGLNHTTDVSGSWVTTTLVQRSDMSIYYHDIAVDSNNNIHICYAHSNVSLQHLTNVGGSWVNTTVDSDVGGSSCSIAIDSLDNVHMSYYDSSPGYNGDLKYAHNTGGSWTTTFIDNTANRAGIYNSITIDSNDDYHITYSVSGGQLTHLYYASPGVKRNLNNGCTSHASVAVDSNGGRHIACQLSSGGVIVSSCLSSTYNCNSVSSSWTTTNITNYGGSFVVAAFDSNDNLHLNYASNKSIYHSTNASGSWVHNLIDTPPSGAHYHYNDMALDSNDNVHISYSDIMGYSIYYMGVQASGSGSGSGGSGSGGSGSGGSTGTGATETFTFSLRSLADLDGDGLANELPSDYDAAEGPTPGLVADTDDDADGLEDVVETGTSIYVDNNDTGSNPLDPDTDDDGICDGPNAVPPICVAGPDSAPNGDSGPPIWIGLFNKDGTSIGPYKSLPGGTYEIMPDLPQSLTMDPNTGVISGTPTQTLENTTFTVWVNRSDGASLSWNFSIEILADSDGDGLPDELPDDYDPSNPTAPGLVEDLDDDNDGIPDSEEVGGLDSTNPDTDGDGYCDGPISVDPICVAGPDAFPLDPSAHTDTDGDGKPDSITGNSTSVPPLEEDMDDDGDGVEDVNETGTWTYNGPTDTGTNPLNPDTDYDGVCDGPVDVYHPQTGDLICVAGPDTDLGNLAVGAHYAVNGSAIETIRPEWFPTGAVWEVSPDLPADLTIDPDTGIISGIANEVTENVTYTIYGNGTFSDYTSTFNLQVLEDTDRDGLPNALPDDYDNSTVTPMVEDDDDDGDGLSDLAETGTGIYNGTSDYGTDPLNPDTDGDGVCDGPNSVWPICINGPDSNPFGTHDGGNIVLVENIAIETPIPPPNQVPGAVWEISPALPAGLTLDTSTGEITGTATEVSDNKTYTLWANVSDFGRSDSVALSVMATFGLTVLEDSDGDGMPDELPDDYDPTVGILVEDLDDDNDGLLDTEEDALGTDPTNPDSDGDGFCDGPSDVYAADGTLVCRGPDPEPLDSAFPLDTDGDMFPDEDPDGPGGLEADTDDDGDGFSDELENNCGSDPLDANNAPADLDGDTICDMLDPDIDGDGLNNTVETNTGIYISSEDSGSDPLNPDTDGDGYCDGPVSPNYSDCIAGPDAFPTDASAHLDTDGDGDPDTITGNSTTGLVEDLDDDGDGVFDSVEAGCGTDPLDASEAPELDSDGNCVEKQASAESLFEWSWGWCFCLILLLLLLLLIPLLSQRDRILVMMGTGPEPENTVSEPEFKEGAGTMEDPFILEPSKKIKAGESISSKEVITIDKMTVNNVEMIDLNQEDNGDKFSMYETGFDEIGVRLVKVGDDGEITINMHFDDSVGGPTYTGGEFTGLLKLGSASVYLSWTVTVKPDKKKLKEIEKAEKEAMEAEEAAAKKLAEEEAAAKKKAEEEAAAAAKEAEEEEAAAAALLAKEEEEKAAKEAEEAEAKKKAEEEAAKEAEEAEAKKKAEEEAAAKKKADAEAKKAKEAEEKAAKESEEAEAKKKAEEEAAAAALLAKEEEEKAAKKKAEAEAKKKAKKPASPKEAKKQEELQRVKERAKTIDFKVIGKASSSELKSEVKKGAKTLEVADASEFAESGSAQITDEDGSSVIAWTGKDGNKLTGVTGVKRVYGAASIVVVKDDLQVIKGVGPFIEEKLNALGITTYRQIANMNAKLEKQVNEAIEFFPGRVARDQWVAQAKILLGEDAKLDEKALKQAEELERVAKKAEKIDFKTIGVASASDRDNLQELKGIGPFIEEKLNALGIFKFEQIAKMTSKIEDEVNIAIEFFPGRVKRDQWVAQAKIKIGEDVELDEKALKKAEELERVAKKAEKIDFGTIGVASASDKDNLQELKGIGPFIEEKLNALGIFKFEQIAKMTSKIEDEVNIAIEFFPGRVKRDEWVKQAKERSKK